MRLVDCFMQLVAYVVIFQNSVVSKQPGYEQIKADVQRLLSQSEAAAKRGQFSAEDYDQGRFMVCAWVDEALLGSSWAQKNLWQRDPLQRLYYNTFDAGVEVFDRLNTLGFHQRDVREVYYLCLSLGFKGRFIHPGDEFLLEQLRTSNLKILSGSSVGVPSLDNMVLFPEAYPEQVAEISQQRVPFRFSLVTVLALAGPPALFAVLYGIYYFTLGSVAGRIF